MISKTKDIDLSKESDRDLELSLKMELYIDIDSQFAKEIQAEIDLRNYKSQQKK